MNKYSVPYITLVRSQCYSRQHIIGLYGTLADRQAVLRLSWYIRLIRFEDSIRTEKNDSQGPRLQSYEQKVQHCSRHYDMRCLSAANLSEFITIF